MNSDTERRPLPETLVYGGQAVIEGVMMRSPTHMAVAVRKPDGEIVLDKRRVVTFATRHKWARWPVIRGIFALIEAFSIGISALNYSAEIAARAEAEEAEAEETEGEEEAGEDDADSDSEQGPVDSDTETDSVPPEAEPRRAIPAWLMALNMLVSLGIFMSVFILLPTLAADYVLPDAKRAWLLANAVEGGIRLFLIVGYMAGISLWTPIRRIFHYHGAEHQVINTYEAGDPLTVEAAAAHSPLHRRCGTTFLVIVILLKIVVGTFIGWPTLIVRGLLRLALLFPVASLAYEVTRLAAKHPDNLVTRAMIAPGMWIQRVTARRAEPEMLAVSLRAFEAVQPEGAQTSVAQEAVQTS